MKLRDPPPTPLPLKVGRDVVCFWLTLADSKNGGSFVVGKQMPHGWQVDQGNRGTYGPKSLKGV